MPRRGQGRCGRNIQFDSRCSLEIGAAVFVSQNLPLVAPLINPTGPSGIAAAQNRSAVLHRTQDRVRSVLLGAPFTPKPRVIRANEKEIGFRPHRFPNQGGKNILVANQGPDRKSIPALFRLPNLKIERNLALTESTDRPDQFSQPRNQSERERHVLTEGDKRSLCVPFG